MEIKKPDLATSPLENDLRLHEVVDYFSVNIPEVAENREGIQAAGAELINEFDLRPSFFDSEARSLFFVSLANRYDKLLPKNETTTSDEQASDREFIGGALILLAGEHSARYEEFRSAISTDTNTLSAEEITEISKPYIDHEMTSELQQRMDDGLLDDIKTRLGVTAKNELPYELRVLDVASESNMFGMFPVIPENLKGRPYNDPGWPVHFANVETFKEQQQQLMANGEKLAESLYMEGGIPIAWVTYTDEQTPPVLNLPKPVAQKILDPQRYKQEADYADNMHERELATLEHEYVHTQGGLMLDGKVFYGIAFEEVRAEAFSGNKNGYQDVKGVVLDMAIISNFRTTEAMLRAVRGGEPSDFYGQMAKTIGLDAMLEMALTVPKKYIEDSKPLQRDIVKHLGGYDGVTSRLYERFNADPKNRSDMEGRILKMAKILAGSPDGGKGWAGYRKGLLGLNFLTDKIQALVPATETHLTD